MTDPEPQVGALVTAELDYGPSSCQLEIVAFTGRGMLPIVYSPGVCPDGYTPASTITALWEQATTSLCCLKGLTMISTGDWEAFCGSSLTSSVTIQATHGSTATSTTVNSFFAVDAPYTVAWDYPELPLFTPSGLPLIIANESKAETSTSSLSRNQAKNGTGSSYLSAGAQAGIGVAAALAGVAIGTCVMWFFFIRKRSRRQKDFDELEGQRKNADDVPRTPELGVEGGRSELAAKEKVVEMYADVGHEMPPDWGQEADAGMRHELDGSYRGEELTDISTPVDSDCPSGIK